MDYLLRGRWSRVRDIFSSATVELHAPALCDVEVAAVFRRVLRRGDLSVERAAAALRDYLDLPLIRHGHISLMPRMLQLRENFAAYDATYVALAERLGAGLATVDERLRRAIEDSLDVVLA